MSRQAEQQRALDEAVAEWRQMIRADVEDARSMTPAERLVFIARGSRALRESGAPPELVAERKRLLQRLG